MIDNRIVHDMVNLVRMEFADWNGFNNPIFEKEERDYKLEAVKAFNELLSKEKFEKMLSDNDYDEIIERFKKIGQKTNLLYLSTPQTADLAIFCPPKLPEEICKAFFDLLYGEGDSSIRLQRYVDFCLRNNLDCKWTTPTIFLFFAHPDTDYFVKPKVADWLLEFGGSDTRRKSTPSDEVYRELLDICNQLMEGLSEYGPRDMVDIQSFIWVAHDSHDFLKKWFKDFKKNNSDGYQLRLEQIKEFAPLARKMIAETLKSGPITNEKLTAFIMLFKYAEPKDKGKKKVGCSMRKRITTRVTRGTGGEWCQHPRPFIKRRTSHILRQEVRREIALGNDDNCEFKFRRSPYNKYGRAKKPGICPVCLGKLRRISRGGRYAFSCDLCGAVFVPQVRCDNCHRTNRVWHGKEGTVCKGCGKPTKWVRPSP